LAQATTRRRRLAACAHIGERVLEFEQCIFGGRVPVYWYRMVRGRVRRSGGGFRVGVHWLPGLGSWGSGCGLVLGRSR